MYLCQPDSETPLMQKDWRWDTMLRRVWKLCPSRWFRDQVDNCRHPIDVLCDLDLNSQDRNDLSQHGAWCMDVLYPEACNRTGFMGKHGHYVAVGNDAYSKAGDEMLSAEQKKLLDWIGNHDDFERTPSPVNRGNIMEASATLAMITEPQQIVWYE